MIKNVKIPIFYKKKKKKTFEACKYPVVSWKRILMSFSQKNVVTVNPRYMSTLVNFLFQQHFMISLYQNIYDHKM